MGARYIFMLFLIFLVACEADLQAVPTSQHQAPVEAQASNITKVSVPAQNACANVTCSGGQVCHAGNCACPGGKKLCDTECVDSDACCIDSDCDTGICDNGTCSSSAKECRFGEELKSGECQCAKDFIYCREQGKCIARNSCCIHAQCHRFERCVETNWRTSFCIKIEEKKLCKSIADNKRPAVFDIKASTFKVNATDWLSNQSIRFAFENESIILAPNQTMVYESANATLFQEGLTVTGGFCKEEAEDAITK